MSTLAVQARERAELSGRIPMARMTSIELRKMFDTRSGFWLTASIGISALLATTAAILFAPDSELKYSTFASAIGFPIAVILPMIAILSVTGEWSQRTGLATFTMTPHRHQVITAKAIASIAIGALSVLLAFAVGAVGNVVGSSIAGVELVWDATLMDCVYIMLANVLGLLIGFMLGVLIRNSSAAIVAYFIYSGLLPTIFGVLAVSQDWVEDVQPWVDFSYAQGALFEGAMTAEQWANLGVTGLVWLVIPTAVGLVTLMRSEVK